MTHNSNNIIKTNYQGSIHYIDRAYIIRSYKGKIFVSENSGKSYKTLVKIDKGIKDKLKLSFHLTRRLFRFYIYHILPLGDNIIMFGLKRIYIISKSNGKILRILPLKGSRPLVVCKDEKAIYYGEYSANKQRREVNLYQ